MARPMTAMTRISTAVIPELGALPAAAANAMITPPRPAPRADLTTDGDERQGEKSFSSKESQAEEAHGGDGGGHARLCFQCTDRENTMEGKYAYCQAEERQDDGEWNGWYL